MADPKSDMDTALTHSFSESRWSQHSEIALKFHGLFRAIKHTKSNPWPTDYVYCLVQQNNEAFLKPKPDINASTDCCSFHTFPPSYIASHHAT